LKKKNILEIGASNGCQIGATKQKLPLRFCFGRGHYLRFHPLYLFPPSSTKPHISSSLFLLFFHSHATPATPYTKARTQSKKAKKR